MSARVSTQGSAGNDKFPKNGKDQISQTIFVSYKHTCGEDV